MPKTWGPIYTNWTMNVIPANDQNSLVEVQVTTGMKRLTTALMNHLTQKHEDLNDHVYFVDGYSRLIS